MASLLEALNGDLLAKHGVVFAGGCRLTLAFGEYRVSQAVDFLAADRKGYASLRAEVRQPGGTGRLFLENAAVELAGEARIDQYGIRFPVVMDGTRLKVEFVAEGRIPLAPGEPGLLSDVPWETLPDCYAEKLLANSDRWADDAYLSRDLIDLAALRVHAGPIPEMAWQKATDAYGMSAADDLRKAATEFARRSEHRCRCFERLDVRGADALSAAMHELCREASSRLEE
ncbi:MAG: nucleotidyl transferase AbiEii/AbiGii toxin family protein [Polyangiaceae bacterium]|nr:nucleotidyl transferase AbiEii/AbiGii toxin family protein [Polyangiaceae bacterium]